MSIFADENVKEFEISGYTFGIKELTYGASTQINKKAMSINYVTNKPEIDMAVLQEEKIKHALAYIKDDKGNEMAVTLEVIRRFKEEVAHRILEELDKLNDVSEAEKKN